MRKSALWVARSESADPFIVELGALLHDAADHKFHGGDYEKGAHVARTFLESHGVNAAVVDHVCEIVRSVSFSKGSVPPTIEGKCVQDADRLDALGAIGIARCFAYGGYRGQPIYDPDGGGSLRHFHDKLYKLKDKMNTASARGLAQGRHKFMQRFEKELLREWDSCDLDRDAQ